MEFLVLDDSYQTPNDQSDHLFVAVGGAVINESNLRNITDCVTQIKYDYNFPIGEEIKWSPRGEDYIKEAFKVEDGTGVIRDDIYNTLLRELERCDAVCLVAAIDTGQAYKDKKEVALGEALKWILERFNYYLQEQEDRLGLVIIDRMGERKKDATFLETALETLQKGTEWVSFDRIPIGCVQSPSHLCALLQLADLVVGITTAMVVGRTEYAGKYWPLLKDRFYKAGVGSTVGGRGLKLFPDTLMPIYRKLFGETHYIRGMMGVPISESDDEHSTL